MAPARRAGEGALNRGSGIPDPGWHGPRHHACMTVHPEIALGDLRTRSGEIMDAVERGESFIVTLDGRPIGKLIPLRRGRRFVSRQEFTSGSGRAPATDLEALRADQDAALDQESGSPRWPG